MGGNVREKGFSRAEECGADCEAERQMRTGE